MRANKMAIALALLMVAGLAMGLTTASAIEGQTVTASIVEVDTEASTLTFTDAASDRTLKLPVEDGATRDLGSFEPGDEVTLTCRRSEDGSLVAITAISKA